VFARYIGSHPLAGSEKRSVVNADSRLFNNSLCILTPIKNTDRQTLAKIKRLWSNLGAKTVSLTPQRHDKILSFVSHLPHIAAFSLINAVPRCYLKFASTGLKDTTRIAASDSELWSEIFLGNRKNIVKTIELFQESLATIKSAIKSKNGKALAGILKEAKKKREFLN
jgi:prephenate dehydrogenase